MFATLIETENSEDVDTLPFKDEDCETIPPVVNLLAFNANLISCQQFDNGLLLDRHLHYLDHLDF